MSLADGQVDGQYMYYFDFFKAPLCGFNDFNIDLLRLYFLPTNINKSALQLNLNKMTFCQSDVVA